jgi:PilZ domain
MNESHKLGQEQRTTFRVAVRGRERIDAHLLLAGKKLPAAVGDVSSEGIFVRLERGLLAALKLGAEIDVEVTFEGDTFVMRGVIRSQHANGYGIYFPERDRAGRSNALGRFGRISTHLQRNSLSQRLKVLKLPE